MFWKKHTTFVFKNIVQSDPDGWLRKNQTCLSALPRVIEGRIASSYKKSAFSDFFSRKNSSNSFNTDTIIWLNLYALVLAPFDFQSAKTTVASKMPLHGDIVSAISHSKSYRFDRFQSPAIFEESIEASQLNRKFSQASRFRKW